MLVDLADATLCTACARRPTADVHKGDDVLVCPGCDRILVRL